MVALDRETLTAAAIAVALAATFYLYKELKQTNQDVLNCKNYSQTLASQLTSITSQAPVDDVKKYKKKVTIKEEEVVPQPSAEDLD
jgi:hypothetical protein